jgi:hypothetical protein
VPSDVIEAHVSRLPPLAEDDWTPRVVDRTELERALLVANEQGRTQHVLVFDDHVDPNAYWPVFLALTSNEV